MKKVTVLGFLILALNTAYADTQDDNFLNLNGTFYAPGTTITEEKTPTGRKVVVQKPLDVKLPEFALSKLENKVFNRTFTGDYNLSRLQRLEKQVYGAVQTGDAQNRLQRLLVAARSYSPNPYNYYQQNQTASNLQNQYNPYNAYNTNNPYNPYSQYRPFKQSKIRNFLNTFSGGTLTGWSPPVTGYNTQSGYQSPYSGYQNTSPTNGIKLFSNGASGRETYWDDGQYQRHLNSADGGIGVKIIY